MIIKKFVPDIKIPNNLHKIARDELVGCKRLPFNLTFGFVATVYNKARMPRVNPIPLTAGYIIQDVIYDELYGGIEPEFDTEEEYINFNITMDSILTAMYVPVQAVIPKKDSWGIDHSPVWSDNPYRDKRLIPYLIRKVDFEEKYLKHIDLSKVDSNYNFINI